MNIGNVFKHSCILVIILLVSVPFVYGSRAMKIKPIAGGRVALIVGNSDYSVAPLRNPENDAKDIAATLQEKGFDVILKINSDQREFDNAIREFGRRLKFNEVGLFYYAGHGMQIQERNYLIPIGARIETESDVRYEGIDAGKILGKMEDAGNDMNIIILDACRNNPFARSFRSSQKGLARMDAPKGSLIAYATSPGAVASDGEGRNGLFTRHLIENIKNSGLKLEDILKRVRIAVIEETGNRQIPWESSSLTGDFYFDTSLTAEADPPKHSILEPSTNARSSDRMDPEEEFWQAVKDSKRIDDYKQYINIYPHGRFRSVAELRLNQLTRQSPLVQEESVSLMGGRWDTWQASKSSSEHKVDHAGNKIWQYSLPEKDNNALAGLNLAVESISLQGKQMQIHFHSQRKNTIWIWLYSFVPGFSKENSDDMRLVPAGRKVYLNTGINTVTITRENITIPDWWLEEHGRPAIKFRYTDIRAIGFMASNYESTGPVSNTIRIESVNLRTE